MARTLCVLAAIAALCVCTANVSAHGPVVALSSVHAVDIAHGAPCSCDVPFYAPARVYTVPAYVAPYSYGYPYGYPHGYRGIYRPWPRPWVYGGGYFGVGPVIYGY